MKFVTGIEYFPRQGSATIWGAVSLTWTAVTLTWTAMTGVRSTDVGSVQSTGTLIAPVRRRETPPRCVPGPVVRAIKLGC
jgi:hypothetical protein